MVLWSVIGNQLIGNAILCKQLSECGDGSRCCSAGHDYLISPATWSVRPPPQETFCQGRGLQNPRGCASMVWMTMSTGEVEPWLEGFWGKVGPVTYLVRLENGEEWRCHIDHLRSGSDIPAAEFPTENNNEDVPFDNVPSLSSPPVLSTARARGVLTRDNLYQTESLVQHVRQGC